MEDIGIYRTSLCAIPSGIRTPSKLKRGERTRLRGRRHDSNYHHGARIRFRSGRQRRKSGCSIGLEAMGPVADRIDCSSGALRKFGRTKAGRTARYFLLPAAQVFRVRQRRGQPGRIHRNPWSLQHCENLRASSRASHERRQLRDCETRFAALPKPW
jgi:hypothetical protein